MYVLSKTSPGNVLAAVPVFGLDRGFMPSSSFLVSMLYIFLLRFFIALSSDILFVVATTLHLHTFRFSTYLFFCQYIVNIPSKFFSTLHVNLKCIQDSAGEI